MSLAKPVSASRLERVHVAAQDRRAVGVGDGRRRPLELGRLRQDVGRERDVRARGAPSSRISRTRRSCAGFMCALIRQTATDSRSRARILPGDVAHRLLVERRDDGSRVVDPLVHLEPVAARDERRRRIPEDVVELLAVRPPDLEHVAEAARRDERERRARLRDHRVRRHGRAVEDRLAPPSGAIPSAAHALDDAEVEARRRRGHLGDPRLARVADGEDIGERSTGVTADDPAHRPGRILVCLRAGTFRSGTARRRRRRAAPGR